MQSEKRNMRVWKSGGGKNKALHRSGYVHVHRGQEASPSVEEVAKLFLCLPDRVRSLCLREIRARVREATVLIPLSEPLERPYYVAPEPKKKDVVLDAFMAGWWKYFDGGGLSMVGTATGRITASPTSRAWSKHVNFFSNYGGMGGVGFHPPPVPVITAQQQPVLVTNAHAQQQQQQQMVDYAALEESIMKGMVSRGFVGEVLGVDFGVDEITFEISAYSTSASELTKKLGLVPAYLPMKMFERCKHFAKLPVTPPGLYVKHFYISSSLFNHLEMDVDLMAAWQTGFIDPEAVVVGGWALWCEPWVQIALWQSLRARHVIGRGTRFAPIQEGLGPRFFSSNFEYDLDWATIREELPTTLDIDPDEQKLLVADVLLANKHSPCMHGIRASVGILPRSCTISTSVDVGPEWSKLTLTV